MSKESALHNNNWCTETKLTSIDLANAMDEYAEEVLIGFTKWSIDYKKIYRRNGEVVWRHDDDWWNYEPTFITTKELFQKYKQEQLCNPSPKI